MTDDLIRRSDAIEAECNHCGWRSQCEEDSGYWCESGGLIRRDIPSVDAVPIADYRSMENTCYKLQKALYERAEQTEPQTEYKKWNMPKVDKPTEITTCVQVPACMLEDEPKQVASKLSSVENSTVSACESTMGQPKSKLEDEPQTDYDKGLQLFADILFDKEKSEQFLKECKAMGIEPQTERSE